MSQQVRTLLQRAWQAIQAGQWQAACDAAHEATRADAGAFDAWRMLGIAALRLGRAELALQALQRAHVLKPGDAGTALDLGGLWLDAGQPARARPLLADAAAGLPGDPRAQFRLATAAYAQGDFEVAARGFEAATRLQPDWVMAWNNLAAAHGRRGDYPAAIAAARNVQALAPVEATGHFALAALLSNRFDRDALGEGLRAVEEALRLDPGMADAHRIAALLLRKLDAPARAEAHARRALALAPDDADNVDACGEQLLLNDKPREATEVYAAALQRGVDAPALRRQLGIALLQDGRAGDARQALYDALSRAPDDQRTIAHLGVATADVEGGEAAGALLGVQRHVHRIALPTPPGFPDAARFHAALAGDIRRHSQQRWEPAGLAARQAYLSGDLLADRTAAIVAFEQALRAAIDAFIAGCKPDPKDVFLRNIPRDYVLHVWATQAAEGGHIDTHIHEASWLSGAYYVELPPAVAGDDGTHPGWIEFGRPYPHLAPAAAALRLEQPRVGDLLLFPSYLFHRTLPYRGAGERISISFDLAAA
ncbi:putative 2OG-Fe(II) oxygenase [Marilutibacter aestuarii]|nr:putative 2OG-Fe(II) oxygenase [Lysobacter aestuarii]